jgi:hypothetical protein
MRVGFRGDQCQISKTLNASKQVGFGEAGAEMISASLRGNTSIAQINGVGVASRTFGGNFNTGKVIQGFFGYCDIRNFTDLTEVLQADVVKVVNACAKQVIRPLAMHLLLVMPSR